MKARPLNECGCCGEDFASLRLFDWHRAGKFPQASPADYADRLRAGIVNPRDNWTPEHGRRCLEPDEMQAKGWAKDDRGRWADPDSVQRARDSFQNTPCELQQSARKAA
jgi:hypothetical protein